NIDSFVSPDIVLFGEFERALSEFLIVGMSTVPEVLVARHMNLRVCAISVVTDIGDPDDLEVVTLADMIEIANEAEPKLSGIFKQLIKEL
ncbi:MAG: hypothetical protein AAFP02_26145, partial [Bacteroidota bacterium]